MDKFELLKYVWNDLKSKTEEEKAIWHEKVELRLKEERGAYKIFKD